MLLFLIVCLFSYSFLTSFANLVSHLKLFSLKRVFFFSLKPPQMPLSTRPPVTLTDGTVQQLYTVISSPLSCRFDSGSVGGGGACLISHLNIFTRRCHWALILGPFRSKFLGRTRQRRRHGVEVSNALSVQIRELILVLIIQRQLPVEHVVREVQYLVDFLHVEHLIKDLVPPSAIRKTNLMDEIKFISTCLIECLQNSVLLKSFKFELDRLENQSRRQHTRLILQKRCIDDD